MARRSRTDSKANHCSQPHNPFHMPALETVQNIVLWRKGWELYTAGTLASGLFAFALVGLWKFSVVTLVCYLVMLQ